MSRGAHRHTHRGLIQQPGSAATSETVDAIIVPSARRAAALEEAGRLAAKLGCVLLVLCSKHADASKAVAFLSRRPGIRAIAVDFPGAGVERLPVLETSTVLGETRLRRRTDTSAKRNLGLVLARLAGWKRVVFLDDDILVPNAADLGRAVSLLDLHDGVGLQIDGYPDNSVVCHANRETGQPQETFIGGGALAVPADRIDSFFPEIYNEDWFFLVGETTLRAVSQVGLAVQKPYDPFANPDRARREEFGDVLAEGLFALFDDGGKIDEADLGYWRLFIASRQQLIEGIKARIEPITPRDKHILESLAAAYGRLRFIWPETCVAYIQAWQRDRERWRRFMSGVRPIRRDDPILVALDRLGLRAVTPAPFVPATPPPEPLLREPAAAG